jgi:hypothetical protein
VVVDLRQNGAFFGVVSLCLSRACLGKIIIYSTLLYINGPKSPVSYLAALDLPLERHREGVIVWFLSAVYHDSQAVLRRRHFAFSFFVCLSGACFQTIGFLMRENGTREGVSHRHRSALGQVPAPSNISVKTAGISASGSARKSQKRFRDPPRFRFPAVFARTQPFQRSNKRLERGDHPI